MKWLLALFLALLSVVAFSATPNIHRPHRRVSAPRKTQIVVPWKTVAKAKPEVFAVLTWPVRWAAFVLFLLSGCWITKKLLELKTTSN